MIRHAPRLYIFCRNTTEVILCSWWVSILYHEAYGLNSHYWCCYLWSLVSIFPLVITKYLVGRYFEAVCIFCFSSNLDQLVLASIGKSWMNQFLVSQLPKADFLILSFLLHLRTYHSVKRKEISSSILLPSFIIY